MRSISRSPAGVLVFALLLLGIWFLNEFNHDESPDRRGSSGEATVAVDRVVDGDTVRVWIDGKSESVRYIGIDTPESVKPDSPVECFGEEAKRFNQELLDDSPRVTLVFGREKRDRFGRLLAYVYSGGRLLQAEMLRLGFAITLEVPPNTSRASEFSELEEAARAAGRGLWSAC